MNWKQATRAQLCEIAFNDAGAPLKYKIAAAEEIKRRNREKYPIINYREKKVYPK
jgi:hypothetical protein